MNDSDNSDSILIDESIPEQTIPEIPEQNIPEIPSENIDDQCHDVMKKYFSRTLNNMAQFVKFIK